MDNASINNLSISIFLFLLGILFLIIFISFKFDKEIPLIGIIFMAIGVAGLDTNFFIGSFYFLNKQFHFIH